MKKTRLHMVPPHISGDAETAQQYIARCEDGIRQLDEALTKLRAQLEKQKAEARKLRLI